MTAFMMRMLVTSLRKNHQRHGQVVMIVRLARVELDGFAEQVLGGMYVLLLITRAPLLV
jgi:hypothetical protein